MSCLTKKMLLKVAFNTIKPAKLNQNNAIVAHRLCCIFLKCKQVKYNYSYLHYLHFLKEYFFLWLILREIVPLALFIIYFSSLFKKTNPVSLFVIGLLIYFFPSYFIIWQWYIYIYIIFVYSYKLTFFVNCWLYI